METITLTRKELYDLIWTAPMSSMTKKYELSYSELRRICNDMRIPVPESGYWSKIHFGKPVVIEKLPDDCTGKNDISLIVRNETSDLKKSSRKSMQTSIEQNPKLPIKVPEKLSNPDQLIIEAKQYLNTEKRVSFFDHGLQQTRSGLIDMKVSPENVGRALRFMDTLIRLLRARDHDIIINHETTYAVVLGVKIKICLMEKLRIEETMDKYGWRSRQYFPSGILTFRMWMYHRYYQKIKADGKQLIEDQLSSILACLELMAKSEIEKKIRQEAEHKIWLEEQKILQEKQKIKQEIKKHKEKELKEFKKLLKESKRWHKAQVLRAFIRNIENSAKDSNKLSVELKSFLSWAREKADWYDPLVNKEDPILSTYNRPDFIKDHEKY
jgi:hypothetical protein